MNWRNHEHCRVCKVPIPRGHSAEIPKDLQWIANAIFYRHEIAEFANVGVCQKCWESVLHDKIFAKWMAEIANARKQAFDYGWSRQPFRVRSYLASAIPKSEFVSCSRCDTYLGADLKCPKCGIQFDPPPKTDTADGRKPKRK